MEFPKDPKFGDQWALKNTRKNSRGILIPGKEGIDVNALKAWEITKGGEDIIIAVRSSLLSRRTRSGRLDAYKLLTE